MESKSSGHGRSHICIGFIFEPIMSGLAITNGLSVLLSFEPVCQLVMPVVYAESGLMETNQKTVELFLSYQILHTRQA